MKELLIVTMVVLLVAFSTLSGIVFLRMEILLKKQNEAMEMYDLLKLETKKTTFKLKGINTGITNLNAALYNFHTNLKKELNYFTCEENNNAK